ARPGHPRLNSSAAILASRVARPRMTPATLGSFGSFCSVFRTPLFAVLHALGIEHAAQDMVTHTRQILHAAAANHHDRMLLQIVALAGDVADHFEAVGEPHLG